MGNCLEGISRDDDQPKSTTKPSAPKPNTAKVAKISRHDSTNMTIHSNILQSQELDVYKKYTEVDVIGRGSMGHVAKVVAKENPRPSIAGSITSSLRTTKSASSKPAYYALKSIILQRISTTFVKELKNEIDILNAMDHPNIVKLHEVITFKKQIFLVQELCDGGDLYTRLPYTEHESAYITGKLLSAVKYMHDHAIVHRDLKFENIMFESNSPDSEVKLIDFGLSKKYTQGDKMQQVVGTPYTIAPGGRSAFRKPAA